MRFGLIARADFGRGLANQTYSFYSHLKPDVTVVVDISPIDPQGKWPQDFSAYPDAIRTEWRGYTANFDNPEAFEALESCDLIYTAETYYDPRLEKVPAILHVNPEFYRGEPAEMFWYPTIWELDRLPSGHVVPTPIADEDIEVDIPPSDRLLHVGGHSARSDRNGSRVVHGILQQVKHPWRIQSQDGMRLHPHVMAYVEPMGYVDNRWELYKDCGILVYPRRYGGQSLQVNEAAAKGLAIVMPDCAPNIATWPIVPFASRPASYIQTPGGKFQMHMGLAPALAETLRVLLADRDMLERYQCKALAWARDNAWSQWKPRIEALIGR